MNDEAQRVEFKFRNRVSREELTISSWPTSSEDRKFFIRFFDIPRSIQTGITFADMMISKNYFPKFLFTFILCNFSVRTLQYFPTNLN